MTSNKKFTTRVEPYFYPTKECYMLYSSDQTLSTNTEISILDADSVKNDFGFMLLCDNFKKSVREASNYYKSNYHIDIGYKGTLIQKDYLKSFIVHPISSKIGLGVSTLDTIKAGAYIGEYVGERLAKHISPSDTTYIFLNHDGTSTDAKYYGNIARFFSHCPNEDDNDQILTANILAIVIPINSVDKLFFKASRDIKAFEPLCWDYGGKYSFGEDTEFLDKDTYLPIEEYNQDESKDFLLQELSIATEEQF